MKFILMVLSTFLLVSTSPLQPKITEPTSSQRIYTILDIEGWTVLVNTEVVTMKNWSTAHRLITNQLFDMKRLLKDEVILDMQKIKIYVDLHNAANCGAEYHPSKDWLIENGISIEKERCVEITDIDSFVNDYSKYQPYVILHELMHGYHHQVLGFDNQQVHSLFNKAVDSEKYDKVLHAKGKRFRHYAMSDEKEYLSEAVEAYFGTNDFYPFVRAELMEVDPDVCKFLKQFAK